MYVLPQNQNPSPQRNFLSAEAWLECPALAFWMACFLRGSCDSICRWVIQNDVLWPGTAYYWDDKYTKEIYSRKDMKRQLQF